MDIASIERSAAIATWHVLLEDRLALIERPGAKHKALIAQAYALHRSRIIDCDDLCGMLELADEALAFAVEDLLDVRE